MIIYNGPSAIDGKEVVVIATGIDNPSRNPKTGPVVQVWILNSELSPVDAIAQGEDFRICGDCKHRHNLGGSCYVVPGHAPTAIWKAFHNGKYAFPSLDDVCQTLSGRIVRLGAYGDPAAVPASILQRISDAAGEVLAYSHAWRDRPDLAGLAMASVDTLAERLEAKAAGWRTFRVTTGDKTAGESVCPSADESKVSRPINCMQCKACNGNRRNIKGDIVIRVHGTRANRFSEDA